MYYVYRIRSRHTPEKTFVGISRSVKKRLAVHNSGGVSATCDHKPWRIVFYAAFSRKRRAEEFYDFLTSPAGEEFGRKHLWQHVTDYDEP